MKNIKKIYANKNDSCAVIVNKVISSSAEELILYLPKGSFIAEIPKNFKLLKREALAVNKKIIIESVDNNILEIASSIGFEVIDGLFNRKSSTKIAMDIVPVKSNIKPLSKNKSLDNKKIRSSNVKILNQNNETPSDKLNNPPLDLEENIINISNKDFVFKFFFKKILLFFIIFTTLVFIGYLALFILPRANISIERHKIEWPFSGIVTASVDAVDISREHLLIPSQIFIIEKNGVYSFPATGVENIERKATGRLIVWNTYSSSSQRLIRGTRFSTPNGKIYQTMAPITVPGARIVAGRIEPSSIEVDIVASVAGEEFNIGPTPRLTLPGFAGTTRYDGFYGELKTGTSGGFIGEIKIPTESDIAKAKKETEIGVRSALEASVLMTVPPEFKKIENKILYKIIKEGVASEVNEQGEFSYGIMMEAHVPTYKEKYLINLMQDKFSVEHEGLYDLILQDISYSSDIVVDFNIGRISLPITFNGVWARNIDLESFKNNILGKTETELRRTMLAIPGISNAKINLQPFWVRRVPKNIDKVNISVY